MKENVCVPRVDKRVYYAQRLPFGVQVNVADNGFFYPLGVGDFDWGCNGRYSLNLSKAILTDFVGEEISDACAKDFNRDFISCMPTAGFSLPGEAIAEWLRDRQLEPAYPVANEGLTEKVASHD